VSFFNKEVLQDSKNFKKKLAAKENATKRLKNTGNSL
jgi:hypothetical protein